MTESRLFVYREEPPTPWTLNPRTFRGCGPVQYEQVAPAAPWRALLSPSFVPVSVATQGIREATAAASSAYDPLQISLFAGKVLMVLAVIAGILYAYTHHDVLLVWLASGLRLRKQLGAWYPLLFICIHAAAVACYIPSELITICGGFLLTYDSVYGYMPGLFMSVLYVMLSLFFVSSIHFWACRTVVKPRLLQHLPEGHVALTLRDALNEGGFKAALTLRLVPVMPFALGSGVLGLTDLNFFTATTSLLGAMPLTIFFCWIGADADGLDSIFSGEALKSNGHLNLVVSIVTVLSVMLAVWYVGRLMRRRMDSETIGRVTLATSLSDEVELPMLLPSGRMA